MLKKIAWVMLFLSALGVTFVSAQAIDIKILREETVKDEFDFLLLDVKANGIPDRTIVRAICNFLQRNYLLSGVDLNSIEEIDDDQFLDDLGLGNYRGGHPIYENNLYEDDDDYYKLGWHCMQYNRKIYIMKGRWPKVFYRINITG